MPHTIKLELSAADLVILKECQNTYDRQIRELKESELATQKIFAPESEDAAEASAFYADLSRPLIKITDALARILDATRAQLDCEHHEESEGPASVTYTGRFDTGSKAYDHFRAGIIESNRQDGRKRLDRLGFPLIIDANLVPKNVIAGYSSGAKSFTVLYLDTGVLANYDLYDEGTRLAFPDLVKMLTRV